MDENVRIRKSGARIKCCKTDAHSYPILNIFDTNSNNADVRPK